VSSKNPHLKKAIKNYKKFHGGNPERLSSFQFSTPKSVTFLGWLYSIKYESTKKLSGVHRMRLYEHKTGPGVRIYLHPDGKSLIITGGKFRVTDWMRG
jgi:hypothetical protein